MGDFGFSPNFKAEHRLGHLQLLDADRDGTVIFAAIGGGDVIGDGVLFARDTTGEPHCCGG